MLGRKSASLSAGLFALFFAAGILPAPAHAESVAVPFKADIRPASDLLYQGAALDPDRAATLQGVDLSVLDPVPSAFWSPPGAVQNDPNAGLPGEGAKFNFVSNVDSRKNVNWATVRVSLPGSSQIYYLSTSLETHGALARLELLRRLGYHLSPMKRLKQVTVTFKSVDDREAFISRALTMTQTSESRWVVSKKDSPTEVTLQDVALEPAQTVDMNYQWGVIPDYRINPTSTYPSSRAFRAMIAPLTVLDIPEAPGRLGVTAAQIFGDSLVLTQRSAPSFNGISSIDDIRWAARKMSALTRADWQAIIQAGDYPDDIAALILEKTIGRRNQLNEVLGNSISAIPNNPFISIGSVVSGKVTQESYPGYALRFTYEDPDSPVRTGEILRYLQIEGTAGLILKAAQDFNALLPQRGASDVAYQHAYNEAVNNLKNGKLPTSNAVRTYGGFTGNMNVSVNRNVVTGNYYGDESTAQLVDSLAVQFQLGYFLGVEGVKNATPGFMGNVVLQRNLIHVRPIKNMGEAVDADWKMLDQKSYMVELAQALTADDSTAAMKAFLDKLKTGEMFVITDSLAGGLSGQVNIPLANLLGLAPLGGSPAIGLSDSLRASAYSRTTITKTEKGIQVYLQGIPKFDPLTKVQSPTRNVHTLGNEIAFDFDWWINVFKASREKKSGTALTRAYLLDHDDGAPERDRRLARSLKTLLDGSSAESLDEDFRPYILDHDMNASGTKVNFLAWTWNTVEEAHVLKIDPPGPTPGSTTPNYNPADFERTFFNTRIEHIQGVAEAEVVSKVVNYLSKGFTVIPPSSSNDPADTLLGRSEATEVSTEAELTPSRPEDAVTNLEHRWRGWSLSRDDLYAIMDGLQASLAPLGINYSLFQKGDFAAMQELQLYEITSSALLYKEGVERIRKAIAEAPSAQAAADFIKTLMSKKDAHDQDVECALQSNIQGDGSPVNSASSNLVSYFGRENGHFVSVNCLPLWTWQILEMRAHYPSDRMGQLQWTNRVIDRLQKNIPLTSLIQALGTDNVFYQVRIQGFRKGIEETDEKPTFTSQTFGAFNANASAGPLRDLATKTGISTHEIYSRYLSEGY